MPKLNDAEYGKHIREQSKVYWLRFKAIQNLKNKKLAEAKIVLTEDEIKAEIAKSAKK